MDKSTSLKGQLLSSLQENEILLQQALGGSTDLVKKKLILGANTELALFYIDGLVDTGILHNSILYSLTERGFSEHDDLKKRNAEQKLGLLKDYVLMAGDIKEIADYDKLLHDLLSGCIILLLEGANNALRIALPGWEDRNVGEPSSQAVIRGPMEGFTERLRTNTALIRRKIKDRHLWLETFQIGKVTQTDVAIMYLDNVVNAEIVNEVKRRLHKIDTDSILESGYIEEFIQDTAVTPFPTIYNSDRPDTIAAGILDGKVAILVDGTPFVLLVPAFFLNFFQSAEDYYQRADIATLLRFIRYLAFFVTMLAPALYVAITTYHQEMIPTTLVISLAAQRETVPFPAFVEAMLMEIVYEVLREAGVRIPKNIGQAISIVGTLVIGQAAVEAGFISSAMVIIVSVTAISSFVIPETGMSIAARIIRFVLMALGAFMGLYGILFGIFMIVLHLAGLRSFGMPYMSPLGPYIQSDLKDSVFRFPWPKLTTRPKQTGPVDLKRQGQTGGEEP
ncbi:spore germination protein [Paenibacillus sp. FSL R5-0527]|uniref:spore germination protein n=1 Tax=Paenibacillus sp. FSL R5-0527 TaxID=2975321 RepID=UPI00097AEDF2|nr:spore germination protein [Paenibacillus macerans]